MGLSGELPKSKRMFYVWQVIKSSGRGTADSIYKGVVQKIGSTEIDKNFKRNIYRDLKDLAARGDIAIDYFTPDGSKIDNYDESIHKNVRTEYYIPGDDGKVIGAGLLTRLNCEFFRQRKPVIDWIVRKPKPGVSYDRNSIHVILNTASDHIVELAAPADCLPVKLIIARWPDDAEGVFNIEMVEKQFGLRTSVLMIQQKSVSRFIPEKKWGHCVIEWKNDNEISITDFRDEKPSQIANVNPDYIEKAVNIEGEQVTIDPGVSKTSPFSGLDWRSNVSEVQHRPPLQVKIGPNFLILT